MFSIRVSAADVDWQIRLIKEFPDIADRHFKPAMKEAVGNLAQEIEPGIPVLSGRSESTFKERVSGKGLRLTGRVGWWYASDPFYIVFIEHGTKYITGRKFMTKGQEAARSQNDSRFETALDKTVKDMTVKGGLG